MKKFQQLTLCALAALSLQVMAAQQKIARFLIGNDKISAEITPDIGGRLLSFSLVGKPNFLRVGEAVEAASNPDVNPQADNIAYLGHEIWVGPQHEWWVHQDLNGKRAEAKADWPPDPYLILPQNKVLEKNKRKVVLQSPESPITGVQLTKTYELVPGKKDALALKVSAKNIRKENIAWDIWFNTRAHGNTQVYVPVAADQDIRLKAYDLPMAAPLVYSLKDGVFSLDLSPPPEGKKFRNGKIMIQPSQGWMAGFHGEQLFIVKFPLQPVSAIHPAQGQIELYSAYDPRNPMDSLLEMEVHAPYRQLAPAQTMHAEEQWIIMEYKGPATREAQLAFLNKHKQDLQLR